MKCPICQSEMEEGGLVIDGVAPCWVPLEQYRRKGLKRLLYTGARTIGRTNLLLSQTKIDNAHFCRHCSKIIGYFDVTNNID